MVRMTACDMLARECGRLDTLKWKLPVLCHSETGCLLGGRDMVAYCVESGGDVKQGFAVV